MGQKEEMTMDSTHYSIGKFAELSGIPVRTLHYYEETGLLCPRSLDNGHRIYGTADLIALQKIIGLKSLGFSLERICKFIHHRGPEMNLVETLRIQQQALQAARAELDRSLEMLGRLLTIVQREGGTGALPDVSIDSQHGGKTNSAVG